MLTPIEDWSVFIPFFMSCKLFYNSIPTSDREKMIRYLNDKKVFNRSLRKRMNNPAFINCDRWQTERRIQIWDCEKTRKVLFIFFDWLTMSVSYQTKWTEVNIVDYESYYQSGWAKYLNLQEVQPMGRVFESRNAFRITKWAFYYKYRDFVNAMNDIAVHFYNEVACEELSPDEWKDYLQKKDADGLVGTPNKPFIATILAHLDDRRYIGMLRNLCEANISRLLFASPTKLSFHHNDECVGCSVILDPLNDAL